MDGLEEANGAKRNPKFKGMSNSEVEDVFREALDKWIWEIKNKVENKAAYEEAEQELKDRESWHLQDELFDAMAKEITEEIDAEVLKSLTQVAKKD